MIPRYRYQELEKISLLYFKPFLDETEIEIKPITILIGPNSSGKSSIIQFLLFLKQSSLNTLYSNPFTVNGEYINLDSYKNMIYSHNVRRNMQFSLTVNAHADNRYCFKYKLARNPNSDIYIKELYINNVITKKRVLIIKNNQENKIIDIFSNIKSINEFLKILQNPDVSKRESLLQEYLGVRRIYIPKRIIDSKIKSEISFEDLISEYLKKKYHYKLKDKYKYENVIIVGSKKYDFKPREIKLENLARWNNFQLEFDFDEFSLRRYSPTLADFFALTRERKRKTKLDQFIKEIRSINRINFRTIFSNMYHIGPIREHPKRYYITTEKIPEHVGSAGEKVISVISPRIMPEITKWINKFDLASKIEIETVKGKIKEIIITDKISHIKSNITDVGFGLSQILPLIVETMITPNKSLFLVEQPEIHLHPKVQAEIGDLLIYIAQKRKKIIVETHSEHLLLRLRRRIAEGSLNKSNVNLYYFLPTKEGTIVKKLEITDTGHIIDWPDGFFDNDFDEFVMIQKALVERKGGETNPINNM